MERRKKWKESRDVCEREKTETQRQRAQLKRKI